MELNLLPHDTIDHHAKTLQRNIRILYYLAASRMFMRTWALGAFLDLYLYDICGSSNRAVGMVESIRGTAQVAGSFLAGWLVDRYSRTKLVKVAAAVRLLPVSLLLVGLAKDALLLIVVALVVFALANALDDAARKTLLQDSVSDCDRTKVLSRESSCIWWAAGLAPLLQLVLVLCFRISDDTGWSMGLLKAVLKTGLCMYPLTDPAAFFLKPVIYRGSPSEVRSSGTTTVGVVCSDDWRVDRFCCGRVRRDWFVALWAECVWLLTNVGAGMTLKFIPIYWKEVIRIKPEGLLMVQVAEPWGLALMSMVTPQLSERIGRARSCVLFLMSGSVFLALFAWTATVVPAPVAAAIFVLRTSTGRAWVPCVQSIIFTCIPAHRRGVWTAVASLKDYSFSLTAGLGGAIVDCCGYAPCFLSTSILQGISALLCVPLAYWFAPAEEAMRRKGALDT